MLAGGRGIAASVSITRERAQRRRLSAFFKLFLLDFSENARTSRSRGIGVSAYSAATIIDCEEQTSSEAWSRIIPHTVSQHFPQFIVVW